MTEDTLTRRPLARHLELAVAEHYEVAPGIWRMVMLSPELGEVSEPGQFLHILCNSGGEPLLRRPFSIHDADSEHGYVSVLYQVVGKGTQLLRQKQIGDKVDVLGPLGTGFTLPEDGESPILLVGGGMAVAPLYFLAKRITQKYGCSRVSILIGARTSDMLVCSDDLAQLRVRIETATEDASSGHAGMVTSLLEEHLCKGTKPLIYACGPWQMLKEVARISAANGLKCEVSTEAKMACGVGACMGCAIKVRDEAGWKYVRCCREGPVFNAAQIIWE